jgi:hypothetical protein
LVSGARRSTSFDKRLGERADWPPALTALAELEATLPAVAR